VTRLSSCWRRVDDQIVLGLEYIMLAPRFVREVLDAVEGWEGKDDMPVKLQELMMVLQIETDTRRYKNTYDRTAENGKDTRPATKS
jgi:hypothetical protein